MSATCRSAREYAALAYALALARGQLSSLQFGSVDMDELNRVLIGTSSANIANALGLIEHDLAVDWSELLTDSERDSIRLGK
jgi:hypothetical protein